MKYINQLQYPDWLYVTRTDMDEKNREHGRTTTIATSGCGLCSAIMVADRLVPESTFGLREAIQLSYDTKANYRGGTSYQIYAPAFAEKMGFNLEMTKDPERLRHCLRTGGAAVVHVTGNRKEEGYLGVFSDRARHYVVAVSEEPDGRIAVLDPAYEEGGYEREGRKGKVEVKNGVVAVCAMKVLEEDSAAIEKPFYLFWRK